eukprot:jgi/Botrbrau1/20954/Bobra.0135s0073.1
MGGGGWCGGGAFCTEMGGGTTGGVRWWSFLQGTLTLNRSFHLVSVVLLTGI